MAESKRAVVARLASESRSAVRRFLEGRGYRVEEAQDGVDALNLLRQEGADLIVADGILPKLSGFELCREAKALASPRPLPVALVLEDGDAYGRGRARAEGADLILCEPLLADDLEEIAQARVAPEVQAQSVLTGRSPTRDRFLKELLRTGPAASDPIVSKISDSLTGLHHKAYMTLKLEEEFKKAQRYGQPLAILLVDVENYAEVSRTCGKPVAQEILLEVAGIFLCESRDVDCAGRVDDARFLLLLPHTTLEGARRMADRVFQQVCSRTVSAGPEEIAIRASVGIAALPSEDVTTVEDFVERALRAMRTASNLGGNRICAWGDGAVVK